MADKAERRPVPGFTCASCFGSNGNVIWRADQFLYVRCLDCGELSVTPHDGRNSAPGERPSDP